MHLQSRLATNVFSLCLFVREIYALNSPDVRYKNNYKKDSNLK